MTAAHVAVVHVLARAIMFTRTARALGHVQLTGGATETGSASTERTTHGVDTCRVIDTRVAVATVDVHVTVGSNISERALAAIPRERKENYMIIINRSGHVAFGRVRSRSVASRRVASRSVASRRVAFGRVASRRVGVYNDGTGRDGTGRDGTGRDGTGRDGTGRLFGRSLTYHVISSMQVPPF